MPLAGVTCGPGCAVGYPDIPLGLRAMYTDMGDARSLPDHSSRINPLPCGAADRDCWGMRVRQSVLLTTPEA